MPIVDCNKVLRVFVVCAALLVPNAAIVAQSPAPTPRPVKPDATKPPGSEQNPSIPPETRPNTQNPARPPSAPHTPAKTPPGTKTTTPQRPTQNPEQNPTASPTPPPDETVETPQEPKFPTVEPRPLPPMPNLTRLGVVSSNVLTLSLNEAIRLALANNNDIEVSRHDVRFAESQLRSLLGVYDPVFSVTPQLDTRVTPVQFSTSGAPSGKLSTSTFSLSPAVTKSFSNGGGTYEVSFSNNRNTTSANTSSLNPYYSSNLALTFTQPLWRNRSIDGNRRNIRIQKKRIEQSDSDFRSRTIDIISQVQSAYWNLVFAMRDQQVQLDNVNLSRENLRQIEAQISAGAKAPLDRSEVLTELANRESSLLTATQTVSIAENTLKQLILKDTTAPQWSAQVTPTDAPVVDTNPVVLNDAIAEARKNRPELQRLKLQNDINAIDIQYYRNQTKPQFDLQTTLATTGLAGKTNASTSTAPGTPVPIISGDPNLVANAFLLAQIQDIQRRAGFPVAVVPTVPFVSSGAPKDLIGGYAKDLANLFDFKTHNITVGVSISLPWKNTIAKENLAGALIQKDQLEASVRSTEQLVEVDVRNAAQSVESARLRVLTSRAARENAEIQLEGEQRLYSVGRSTTYLLIQRQNALANARDQEVRAETDYTKAVANLQRATSTTLHANNVIVDNPVRF